MGKKLALNVAYTVGLFIAVIIAFYGYQHQLYYYTLGGIFIAVIFVILKIRLLKDIRNMQKK